MPCEKCEALGHICGDCLAYVQHQMKYWAGEAVLAKDEVERLRDVGDRISEEKFELAVRIKALREAVRAIATDYSSDSTHWRRRIWDAAQDGTVGPWRGPESGEEEEPMEAGA